MQIAEFGSVDSRETKAPVASAYGNMEKGWQSVKAVIVAANCFESPGERTGADMECNYWPIKTAKFLMLPLLLATFGLARPPIGCGITVCRFETNSFMVEADPDEIHEQILELIRQSSFAEAEKMIDEAIVVDRHDHQIHLLRKTLGNELTRNRQRQAGEQQFEKLLQYILENPEQSQPLLKYLPQLLINLSYIRQNIEPESTRTLEKAMSLLQAAVAGNPQNVAWSNGLTTAVNLQGRGLLQQSRLSDARALYMNELDRLRQRWRTSSENPDTWLRLAYFLKTASEPESEDPVHREFANALRIERMNLLAVGATTFPDAVNLVREKFSARQEQASQFEMVSPPTAVKMLLADKAAFSEVARHSRFNKELLPTRIQIEKHLQQIERNLTKQQLIGNRPPAIDEADWLTEPPDSWSNMAGNVVLLFCFSATNGDSVKELVGIHEVLKNRYPAVKLIAITHEVDQSFTRLSIVKRKPLPDAEDQRAMYRQKILEEIVQRNLFDFPFGIAKHATSIAGSLGITEVPFTLVLDESGVCRAVLVGANQLDTMTKVLNELTGDSRQPSPK